MLLSLCANYNPPEVVCLFIHILKTMSKAKDVCEEDRLSPWNTPPIRLVLDIRAGDLRLRRSLDRPVSGLRASDIHFP
jgi:hypothetical protein